MALSLIDKAKILVGAGLSVLVLSAFMYVYNLGYNSADDNCKAAAESRKNQSYTSLEDERHETESLQDADVDRALRDLDIMRRAEDR